MPASAPSPIPALRVLLEDGDVPPAAVSPGPSPSLLDVLERVEDPRQRRGVRHRLSSILSISVSAVLAGARSYAAIADWAEDIDEPTRAGLGLGGALPHASTIRRLLQALNPAALEAALSAWVRSHRDALAAAAPPGPVRKRRTVLAVDGKTLRGAHGGDGQPAKLVAVYDHAHQLVLTQAQVEGGDEIAAFTAALDTLPDLHGYLITADALHTQREHATYLRSRGAHYLLTVKGNQPTLHRRIAALPWAQVPLTRARQRGHGRAESRTCQVLTLPQAEQHTLFPGAVQVIKVVRRRRRQRSGTPSTQTVYLVTSLSARHADPALIAGWIQGHWAIENTIHWVRDVTYGEDSSAVRTGAGPQVMAALRNLAMNLTRLRGQANIARAHRRYAHQPTRTADDLRTA